MSSHSMFDSLPKPKNLELLLSCVIPDESAAKATAEWIVAKKRNEYDPLLLCYYQPEFGNRAAVAGLGGMVNGQAAIVQAMTANHGHPIVGDHGVAFYFESWGAMFAARNAMAVTHNWAFYLSKGAAMLSCLAQAEKQTIETICVTSFCDDSRKDVNTAPYQFFEL